MPKRRTSTPGRNKTAAQTIPRRRKIPPNTRSVTGRRQSAKNDRTVGVESGLESRLVALLEFDPKYLRYEEQVPIEYRGRDGRIHVAIADFLVFFADRSKQPWLVDVKYRSDFFKDWRQRKPRYVGIHRYARDHGWIYCLLSEVELRTPHSANASWLLHYRRRRPCAADQFLLLDKLSEMTGATPAALIGQCSSDLIRVGELIPTLWHLVATFKIAADLNQPINMQSRIWSAP